MTSQGQNLGTPQPTGGSMESMFQQSASPTSTSQSFPVLSNSGPTGAISMEGQSAFSSQQSSGMNLMQIPPQTLSTTSDGVKATTTSFGTVSSNFPFDPSKIPGLDLSSLSGSSTTTTTVITDASKLPFPLPGLPKFDWVKPRGNTTVTYNYTINSISAAQNKAPSPQIVVDQTTDPNLLSKLDQLIALSKQNNTVTQQIIYPYPVQLPPAEDQTKIFYNVTKNELNSTSTTTNAKPQPSPNSDELLALILKQLQNRNPAPAPQPQPQPQPQPKPQPSTSVTSLTVRPTEYLYDLKYGQGIKPETLGDGTSYTVNNLNSLARVSALRPNTAGSSSITNTRTSSGQNVSLLSNGNRVISPSAISFLNNSGQMASGNRVVALNSSASPSVISFSRNSGQRVAPSSNGASSLLINNPIGGNSFNMGVQGVNSRNSVSSSSFSSTRVIQ